MYPSKYLSLPLPPSVVRAAAVMLFSLTGAFCQLHSCLYAKGRSNGTMRIVWFMVGILMSLKKLGHPQNQFSCRCWKDNYLGLMSFCSNVFGFHGASSVYQLVSSHHKETKLPVSLFIKKRKKETGLFGTNYPNIWVVGVGWSLFLWHI